MLAFSIDYYGIFFGATQSVELFCTYVTFNSLPHAEVEKTESMQIMPITHFNSLPHAEVDGSAWDIHSLCHISTHYLTQR